MSLMTLQPLFAADILETIFPVIVFILWVAAQLLGGRKDAKQKKQPRPRPQQPQPVDLAEGVPQPNDPRLGDPRLGNQGPRNQPRNQEDALRSEVEDFLRRAQGKPPKPQPKPQPVRQQIPLQKPEPERKRLVDAPVASPDGHTLRNEGVAEHVARHISTQDIADRTRTLGAEVATADDQLESRLHATFDHELGRLKHFEAPSATKQPEADLSVEVAKMLRSPEGMRQLIIANEILRRPE